MANPTITVSFTAPFFPALQYFFSARAFSSQGMPWHLNRYSPFAINPFPAKKLRCCSQKKFRFAGAKSCI
jgi:hypothetical protein